MTPDVAKAKAQEAYEALSEAYIRVNTAWVNEPRDKQSKELMAIKATVSNALNRLEDLLFYRS
ncbi:hypothetical protein [Thioclava nitratireducens]|uniref:hypothetical protein n=1 Tax=Thioclava nitratireducens TaxID=1915078 RepID=UPI00247FA378|nr:hypothetical protein [Thioclava nitratireducens]WGT50161.1 hypothetical protein P0N61_17945 [Thioclava nitratireducens]